MKRVIFLMLMLASVAAFAQKQQKPNINKAFNAMKEGKLQEAKDIIDAATTYEKTMNDGKTWYYRGLIYATIDTTSNETVKALDPNALNVAMESFAKADQLGKSGSEYFIQPEGSIVPLTKTQQLEGLANFYLNKGINEFQEAQDYEKSLTLLAKTKQVFETGGLKTYPNDTLTYYVEALVANQAEKPDLAIESVNKYLEKGGKSKDAHLILYQIYYQGPKEDRAKALEVVRNARKAIPNNPDFPKMEIGLLIDMNKIEEARDNLEKEVKNEPNNKILQFYLGYAYSKMENLEGARKSFEEALRIDPAYFEAQFYLANTYLLAVDKTSKTLSATGNTPKDSKRRSELVQQRVKESEIALPYLEKAEKMKAPDKDTEIEVLQKLALLYYYTADDKNAARVAKKLKDLGVEDN
jgi:tetratricopeptide (TPR) repeat protein